MTIVRKWPAGTSEPEIRDMSTSDLEEDPRWTWQRKGDKKPGVHGSATEILKER